MMGRNWKGSCKLVHKPGGGRGAAQGRASGVGAAGVSGGEAHASPRSCPPARLQLGHLPAYPSVPLPLR